MVEEQAVCSIKFDKCVYSIYLNGQLTPCSRLVLEQILKIKSPY